MSAQLGEVGDVDLSGLLAERLPEVSSLLCWETARVSISSAPALVHHFSLPLLINLNSNFCFCTHKFEVELLPGLSVRWRRAGERERGILGIWTIFKHILVILDLAGRWYQRRILQT